MLGLAVPNELRGLHLKSTAIELATGASQVSTAEFEEKQCHKLILQTLLPLH